MDNLNADLVILGGGGAGLAAAVAAAENGADVIVLEKRGAPGGNTALSVGMFAADSPAQKRVAIEFKRDELFKIAVNWAHWKVNPRIVRAFIDKSGDTIRWLEEKGLHFECVPFYPNQSPLVWHVTKGLGAGMMKFLAGECQKLGVQLLTHAPAKKILIGKKGNITGVLAERKGEEFTITAKSIVIASGGYGGNKELLKKYCPHYRDGMTCGGLPHTGDGLLMAMEVGAATEGLGLLLLGGPGPVPKAPMMRIGSPPDIIDSPLTGIILEPNTVWVNKKGERFVDEATGFNHFLSSYAVNRQPDNVCYTLLDSELVQTMTGKGLIIGFHKYRLADQRSKMPGLARELQVLADKGWLKMSDSWGGIADYIGCDPKVLKATIEEYNTACEQGNDPIFAKERVFLFPLRVPPYYAIQANSGILDTIGGIKINEHMEVLDKEDNPIPGLYAAGVVAGGWQGDAYCAVTSGAASGFAISSGRIAAENAVKFIFKEV
jgi:fumarate reductase flavoprotein subunit